MINKCTNFIPKGELDVVKDFCDTNPDLANSRDVSEFGQSFTPLQYAAYNNHLEIAEELLSCGALVNDQNEEGGSALFYASQQGIHSPSYEARVRVRVLK